MAKKGNGHDPTMERMLEVLERIESGVAALAGRIDQTNARLDNLIAVAGSGHRDHEDRIRRLEAEVERLAARGA